MSEDRQKGVQLVLDFKKIVQFFKQRTFLAIFLRSKCSHLKTILCFVQGEVGKGRELIQEGIDMRKKLGVLVYVAAGYCDLGSE